MKKKLSLVLAFFAVMGVTSNADAALWDLNFGKTYGSYTASGLAVEGTSADEWEKATALSSAEIFFSTPATGSFEGSYDYTASGINAASSSITKLQGYVTGLSNLDFNFNSTGFSPDRFEVYLYTTGTAVTLTAGSGTTILSSTTLDTAFADGSGTTYRVTRYYATTNTPGILQLATSADATGRINAVQVRSVVPEPSTIMLLGVGGLIASFGVKRRYATIES